MANERGPERAEIKREQEPAPQNAKERLYDQLRVPIWLLDVIIALCFVGIGVAIYLGTR